MVNFLVLYKHIVYKNKDCKYKIKNQKHDGL